MTKEQAIDQCRKINELVNRGIGGEKESAKLRLSHIMEKYGIDPSELEGEKIEEYSFICTVGEVKFAKQVTSSVLGKVKGRYKYRKRFYFKCTYAQSVDILDRWAHYKKLWEKELEIFYSAFIQKHKLYAKETTGDEKSPLTDEEKEQLRRMFKMMEGMEFSDYKKKISYKV